jgi:hypothetical protein
MRNSVIRFVVCLLGGALGTAAAAQGATKDGEAAATAVPIVEDCRDKTDELVVCGTGRSPYRIPEQPEGFDPRGTVQSVSAERHALYEVGASGIGSCSTSGPGGWTGCDLIKWKRGYEQRAGIKQDQRGGIGLGAGIRVGAIKH